MWAILKVIIEFVKILLLFCVLDFWPPGICGILAPWPGIEAAPPALEDEVLTTGYQGSPQNDFKNTCVGRLDVFSN